MTDAVPSTVGLYGVTALRETLGGLSCRIPRIGGGSRTLVVPLEALMPQSAVQRPGDSGLLVITHAFAHAAALLPPATRPAAVTAPDYGRVPRMDCGLRCALCGAYTPHSPCAGCRASNRRRRETEGWDQSEDTLDTKEVHPRPAAPGLVTPHWRTRTMPVPATYKSTDTKPESKHLRAEDFTLDAKWTLVIDDVNLETMPAQDDRDARNRLILTFPGKTKGLVLNATNQGFLEARCGEQPNAWIGATIVLHRTTTTFGGKTVPAFRLIEARPAAQPEREPGSDDELP